MRIIDADELLKQLKEDAENMQGLVFQMAAGHLIGTIESQATVAGDQAKEERIAELEKCNAVLEKNLEAERNHSKYLYDKSQRLEGVIDALEFAVKCNGVSGPEVTLIRV